MESRCGGVRSASGGSFPIMSFGLEPAWGGMMLALWPAGEDSGASVGPGSLAAVALPHVLPDAFAASASSASLGALAFPQGDFALLQLAEMPSVWAVAINTAKTTGWVVLLGIGSMFLYRVCRKAWPRIRAKLPPEISAKVSGSPSSKRSSPPPNGKYLVEDFDGEDDITGLYFGPVGMDSSTASLPLAGPVTPPTTRGAKKGKVHDDAHGGRRRPMSGWDTPVSIDGDADVSEGSRSPDERLRGGLYPRGSSRRDWRTSTRRRHHQSRPPSGTSSSSSLSPPYPPPGHRVYRYCEERVLSSSSSVASGVPPADFGLLRNASGDSLCSMGAGRRRRLLRDVSVDSLGFPRGASFDSSCSEMSLDSALLAELDAAAAAAAAVAAGDNPSDDGTVQTLERLQREIDQLKNNCLLMDEDLEQVKVNRNLPGLSSLLEVKEPLSLSRRHSQRRTSELSDVSSARACFAGLYSLTTIQNSPSFDLSDCQQPSSLESFTPVTPPESLNFTQPSTISEQPASMASLEWDEDDISAYPESAEETIDERPIMQMSSTSVASAGSLQRTLNPSKTDMGASCRSLLDSDSMLSSLATYELDLESELGDDSLRRRLSSTVDSMDVEADDDADVPDADVADQNARWQQDLLQHRRQQQRRWQRQRQEELQERRRKDSIPQDDVWTKEERITPSRRNWRPGKLTRSSSSSGVSVSSMGSSVTSSAAATPAAELPPPAMTPPPPGQFAVGPRQDLLQYAQREWRGSTPKCATMLKGYSEIRNQLGLRHVRVIRGDNYCGVRATLFGLLSGSGAGMAVSGAVAAERLSKRLTDPASAWLRSWSFSRTVLGRRSDSANGNDVEAEMHNCLLAIDHTVSRLRNCSDRESALAKMLNSDPQLDARLCEGVKLLMILAAIDLHSALKISPESEPVFAQLLFARDTSTTPRDFMNNHLRAVGDTGGLEQVEMFLLGWSLGVNIRVIRVSAVDSLDFVCWYPEENGFSNLEVLDNRKTVDLVAEDDRHYNILLR